jgi:hypothetical protein
LIGALALMVVGSATARPAAQVIRVHTTMSAAEETPKPTGNVDSGRGTFAAVVTKSGTGADLRWTLTFAGLTGPAVMAHIHTGRPGQAGPPVVTLCNPCTNPEDGTGNMNAAALEALQRGDAYVNIHTAMNSAGEIRGQIETVASFTARLSPKQEVRTPKGKVNRARGLLRGGVTKSGTAGQLTFTLSFSRLTGRATGAHIHFGARGTTGRVAVTLCGPCRTGIRKTVRLRPSLLEALEDGLAYVNVHTRRNRGGEIRAQIRPLPLTID